tara:strand:- start:9 stop:932 length:924 start_codon:yes stop_codon:yes gene_type:complete
MKNILIIKHGGLGDLLQVTGIFSSIKEKFYNDKITLLTDRKFKSIVKQMPYFDEIIFDQRSSSNNLYNFIKLTYKLYKAKYDVVFDLQNSDRTSIYHFFIKLFNDCIWSGNRRGGEYKYRPQNFDQISVVDRIKGQLRLMHIETDVVPNVDWLINEDEKPNISGKYIIFVPGSSKKHKDYKRWPAENFSELARRLAKKNIKAVVVGLTDSESEEISTIEQSSSSVINCSNRNLGFLAELSRQALGAVANDTGPTFVISATGCPVTLLLSRYHKHFANPLGSKLNIIQKDLISQITTEEVENNLALRD